MSDLMLDVGQANELKLAFRRWDYTNDDIKKLCEGNILAEVRKLIRGKHSIAAEKTLTIDTDATPFILNGWTVEEHQKGGIITWSSSLVKLHLDSSQQDGRVTQGNKLRKKLKGLPVLNANVLDFLLANPHLIPEEWKKDENGDTRYIFFWGTVYRNSNGNLYVRFLYWGDGRWQWDYDWLDNDWHGNNPALVSAS